MIISLIVAAANNNVIGKNGQMPWHQANDMRYFKNITWGMPVIMGRKTFQALGKALPGRKNIVITRQQDWKPEGVIIVKNLDDALFVTRETDAKEVMVIGGGEIYRLAFEKADRIYLTRIKAEPDGDTYFPQLDTKEWRLVSSNDHEADEKNQYAYSFQVWEKR
ncbi:MAG TPA: type 3 dihydrofolate reductase [Chitinophagaceae bacterium]|nr:type 3 dihydrofolate reductase [Chitinophagaceae bacterium]